MDHAPVGLKEVTREGYEFVLILVLMDHAPVASDGNNMSNVTNKS